MILDQSYAIIDRELFIRYPEYRVLSDDERERFINYAANTLVPQHYGVMLGDGGASAVVIAVIAIIGVLAATTGTIVGLVLQSRGEKDASKLRAATDSVRADTARTAQETAALTQAGTAQDTKGKIAVASVLGLGLIAGAITFFT